MKRREFSIQLGGAALALAAAQTARAQGAPVEGKDYVKLSQPAPVGTLPAGKKVEVLEFFWYECPHCNAFEPLLEGWVARLPADVAFRRVPVGFTARHQVAQKLFYALEEMGQLEALHRKVFTAVHGQGMRLSSEADAATLVGTLGADKAKFAETYKSFQVTTKANKARQLSDAYKIDGVPALGIQGRYFTGASLAGSHQQALAVADSLIKRSR
jgi:protein dithiol oxidoreductase (disulfide-forming)